MFRCLKGLFSKGHPVLNFRQKVPKYPYSASTGKGPLTHRFHSAFSTLKKRILPCERAWNTEPAKGVRNRVHFCLRPLMHLERCGRVLRNRKVILSYLKQKWLHAL